MVKRFETFEVALGWAAALRPVMGVIAKLDADLARQLRRSVASVPLNLAEGAERRGKDRMHLYRIAAGSLAEAEAGLRLGRAWGFVEAVDLKAAEALADRLRAMLWLGLSPSGLRPGRASHAALFACGEWWRLTHTRA